MRDIVVIGASAGGVEAIERLTSDLPEDYSAAIFITMHITRRGTGLLPGLLNRRCKLPSTNAMDGEAIEMGRIYVAPPDYHMLIGDGQIRLSHGPRVNMQRRCINVMFRSAAEAYGPRVIGMLLTGLLDDGAAGLWEIQQRGRATIVQDPEEAPYRSMPESAVRGFNVDHIVRVAVGRVERAARKRSLC